MRKDPAVTDIKLAVAGALFSVLVALLLAALLTGCVSYAKVERTKVDDQCRAVVRGHFFSFSTPAALEECRADEDR